MQYTFTLFRLLVAALAAVLPCQAFACATCGCSVNSDWSAQGLASGGGWSADVRYDYLNQNQLRIGTTTISPAAAAAMTNTKTGTPAEVEQFTKSNHYTAVIDYNNGD